MTDTTEETVRVKGRVNENGRLVIPVEIRRRMGLEPGEVVLMELHDGTLRIDTYKTRIRRVQESFRKYAKPGTLSSDELIADRREAARHAMEEELAPGDRGRLLGRPSRHL